MRCAFSIRELCLEDAETAADLTAQAMRDNPLDIAALGADAERRAERMRRMFRIALPMTIRKGVVRGAFEGTRSVAVAGNLPSAECQPVGAGS